MTRPGLIVPDKTYTIAEDITVVEKAADVHSGPREVRRRRPQR